jgi:Putative Ig domain.
MRPYRTAIRLLFSVTLALPISAFAANFEVKALIDTDNSRSTGCSVLTPGGVVSGIDIVVTTAGTVSGTTGSVTGVTRQTCVNTSANFFSSPIAVDGGWNAGVSSSGDLLVESHLGPGVITMDNVRTPRFVFTTASGIFADALLTPFSWGGGDIVLTHAARDHAVATRVLRTITLDGDGVDWDGVPLLAAGTASSPGWRFIGASAYVGANDLFFKYQIHTNPAAPTAHDDNYALATLGGSLTVSTLGVLNNDEPNNQPITAALVDNPQHGTVALNANGGFTYTNDGALAQQDRFHYVDAGTTLLSNIATVTIDMPGTHPYTFTSPDHVTFVTGQFSTFQVTVTGKPAPALTEDGALPAGISFVDNGDGTGTLSGTAAPNTSGAYAIVFNAEKNKPHQSSQNFTLTIVCPAVTVNNPATSTGLAGAAFSQTFTQSGGFGPITWSETGALPAGLNFNTASGVLSGTPTQPGTFPITVTATDANGCTGSGPAYNLIITCPAITVTNPATTSGTANAAFSQTFTRSGGVGAVAFALNSGTLPTGLTLSSAGVLSGTPTQTGSFPITVKVTDSNGCTGVGATYTLVIACQVITVTNPATNTGTANSALSKTFTASNTIGAVTFSINSGTLPAGLTLSSAGVLSGTPTQTGPFSITVKATDANGCFGVSATYTLTINCQTITVTNPATNTGTVNVAFSQTFTAGNVIAPVTFTLNSGTLPAGITLNSSTGVLSGTPAQTGSFPITVKATDANGCFAIGATYTLTVNCQVITVTNPATNSGTVNAAFSQTFTAGNTIGAVTFTLNSGTLPAGLTLSTGGVLSGTPAQTGSSPITVKATDANGCNGVSATYTLTVNCQVITVTNPATTTGTAGTAFSQTFTQVGGFGATTFAIFSGTLSTGMTFHSATGVLDGTPTQTGSFPLVIRATDSNGCTGNGATYTLVIGCQTITVTNPATTTGTAGTAFSQTFTQSGGIGTTTFAIFSGTLPTGMTFHSATGVLDGTPTQTGSFPLVIRATDSNGCTGDGATYTLVIGCQTITVTNPATTTGTAGTAFSQTFTQSGSIGGSTFSLNSGSLPAGLSLSSAGVLSGTPTQTGSFPITVEVTDGNGCNGTGSAYTLVIGCQTITVTNPATATGTIQVAFSQTFTQSGAIGGATFSLNTGSLPAGLTLSSAGVLSGTPTVTGSFPITVKVTDGNGCTGVGATYNLVINCQTITVTNPATTTGTVSTPFTQTFTQTGANGTATFTTASPLPAGITLATNGTLAGTPTQPGTFPIVVTVTDSNGCTGTGATYTLIISCQTITVTNPGTTSGPAGTPFSVTFTQTGGIGTTTFSESGTLPTGLTFHTATGVLDGTPTQGGTFPITVTATDSNNCTGTGATYNLTITCPVITVTNPGVSTGTAGAAFSQTFTQSGGQGTVTFAIHSGTLPTGMTFHSATGVLDGTPTQTGSFPIVVRATDSNGCTGDGATYTLVIGCQTITVTNPATATGTVNVAFSQTFTQSGAIGGAVFSLNSGSLPAGLALSAGGLLSGTPTQTGSFPITVKVTDGNSCTGVGATYTLVIGCQTITVTNPSSSTGTIQVALTPASSYTFSAANTVGTVTFTVNSGSLPAGVTLTSGGVLTGTPTVTGSFPITVKATDGNTCFGVSSTYTLVINCQTITVSNPAATTATVGTNFSDTFAQTGANGTATFTLNTGSLPTGITLAANGALSGIPTQSGSFPITVKVTDSNGCTGISPTYTLVVSCQTITVTNPATTTGTVGTAFNQTFTQSGGIGTITWSQTGAIPTGMTFHTTTGVLDGTPTQSGSFPITVTATDQNLCAGTGPTYTLVVACNVITVTNPGVTTGTVDAVFSQTFTQSGANGTATFTINSGSLPSGLSLSSAGVLSGTPLVPGSFPITVKVTDSNGCTGTGATYTLVIACQTIIVTNPGVTTGTVDAVFSQTFTQSGVGTHTPATFTLNSGSLPSGLSLSTAGVLSGTPLVPGSFPITVKVTDANGCTGIGATYTLVIACQTITVTNAGTSTAVFNTALTPAANFTFTQTGVGTHTPATFTINSGTLPTGLSLSSAGVLSGTPTQTGTFPITVKVTDANGCFGIGATYNLAITPVAGTDAYGTVNALVDNTQAYVTGGATATPGTPAVPLSGFVTANDLPSGGVSVTAGTSATTQGGSVTIQADGSFLYTPGVHAAAITSDSFTYTITSNTGGTATPTSAIGTVNLTLANRVWYVKDNAPGGGNGQSHSPFNTLALVQTAAKANDIIFVHLGNTVASPLSGGLSLQDGAKLWGEGFGLTVNTHVLVAAGTQPRINNGSGAAVTVDTSAATAGNRQNVEIKGLDLQGTTNGINVTSNAANITGVTIAGNNVRGAGTQGINLNQSSTAAFDATITGTSITSVGNGIQGRTNTAGTMTITTSANTIAVSAGNGVDIRTVAGASALHIALDSEGVTASANGILIDGSAAGTTTITSFLSNSINGNTGGTGISVNTATFDATPGNPFNAVSGGSTVIGASLNGVGASGLLLTTVKGDLSFTDLDIFTAAGTGLSASSAAAFDSVNGLGFRIVVPAAAANIDAAGGPAVSLNTVTGTLPFVTVKSATSPTTGVALNTFLGSFSAGSGSTISGSSGTGFQVGSSNATITYDGTINTTTGKGVDLTNNSGSTIAFTGALTLSSGTNSAFNASGAGPAATTGGTVTATNTTSTLTSTTGTALNVANTTIGASGLKFQSISANGGSSGIFLNNTGASGSLTVSGTGSAGTGGTLQNMVGGDASPVENATVGVGIYLNNTKSPSFNWMNLHDFSNYAVVGTSVNGLTMTNLLVNGTNGTNQGGAGEGDVYFTGLTGSATVTNCTFTGAIYDSFHVFNNASQNLNRITISGSTFATVGGAGNLANDALVFQGTGGTLNVTVQNSFMTGARGDLFNLDLHGVISSDLVFTGNALTNNNANIVSGGGGFTMQGGGAGNQETFTFNISNNTMRDALGGALNIGAGTGAGTNHNYSGTINGNVIGVAGVTDSGSKQGSDIFINFNDAGAGTFNITNNQLFQYGNGNGINLNMGAFGSSNPYVQLVVTGNTISNPGTFGAQGVLLTAGTGPLPETGRICMTLGGAGGLANVLTGSGGAAAPGTEVRIRDRFDVKVGFPGYGGSTTDTTALATYLQGRNTVTSLAAISVAGPAAGTTNGTTNGFYQVCPP